MAGLSPITPSVSSDFFFCHAFYGQPDISDCIEALELFPSGTGLKPYSSNPPPGQMQYTMPQIRRFGTCEIKLQPAGPAPHHNQIDPYWFRPNDVRDMASRLIDECVGKSNDVGGFITRNISDLITYLTAPSAEVTEDDPAFPLSITFYTVTIWSSDFPDDDFNPGDVDPAIGVTLLDHITEAYDNAAKGSLLQTELSYRRNFFERSLDQMNRNDQKPWWNVPGAETDVDMTYACDVRLGGPDIVDCSKLEYYMGGSSSDEITIGPGATTFFHSDTCNVAISATVTMSLSWAQIKSALDMLINLCVGNPMLASVGGRAYFGYQNLDDMGQGGRKKRDSNINSFDALPPHANITVFQQFESFVNVARQSLTCTWQHVLLGQNVRSCGITPHGGGH